MSRISALAFLVFAATWATAAPTVYVNCFDGQSLNRTLAMMNKNIPATVLVRGTCTEYVRISGFNGLTVKGVRGAKLQQPTTEPPAEQNGNLVSIETSTSVTVDGLAFDSPRANAIGIGASNNVQLQNLTMDGVNTAIIAASSVVSISRVTVRDHKSWAAISAFRLSTMIIADSLLQQSRTGGWYVGVAVGSSNLIISGTTIRDMQQGIWADHSTIDVSLPNDVVIENPAGTNFSGVAVGNGSLLNVGTASAKLRITNAGQWWGGNTAGVYVDGGSLNANANLIIADSHGNGIFVSNNSNAYLPGASITGSAHGGLVVVNLSTAGLNAYGSPITNISGNGVDLFCDSRSLVTGRVNTNASSVQCGNVLDGDYENLP